MKLSPPTTSSTRQRRMSLSPRQSAGSGSAPLRTTHHQRLPRAEAAVTAATSRAARRLRRRT
eukprot:2783811-Prymnesium_polylepis.2